MIKPPFYIVERRLFGEKRDIREFIQPDSAVVQQLAAKLPFGASLDTARAAWQVVSDRVKYPVQQPYDFHYEEAYTLRRFIPREHGSRMALKKEYTYDYWHTPAETLALGVDDCEGATFTTTSVLLNRMPCFATIGTWNGYGHAWTSVLYEGRYLVMEVTGPPGAFVVEGKSYVPYVRFDQASVQEFRAGILSGAPPYYGLKVGGRSPVEREAKSTEMVKQGLTGYGKSF